MKRRRFVASAAALAMPFAARAQQAPRAWRIGYLTLDAAFSETARRYTPVFEAALRRAGYEAGRNLVIEYRRADGNVARLPALAEELVRLNVDLIVASTNEPIAAARSATRTIPIVMLTGTTPVEMGFAESLARPGGNVTGTLWNAPETAAKYIEVIRDAAPKAARVALLWNPSYPGMRLYVPAVSAAASRLGMSVSYFDVAHGDEIPRALDRIAATRPDALYFVVEAVTGSRIREVAAFALERKLLSVGTAPQWVNAGGLLYYGPDLVHSLERTANYVDRILRGSRPAELPIELPTRFEMAVNAKTARAIGYSVPPALLARADKVIE